MSVSTSAAPESRALSIGPVKIQVLEFVANSGSTSGTVTADNLSKVSHIINGGGSGLLMTAAPTFSGNVATLAFTVKTETPASLVVQDITYTAVANLGASGNAITIAYVAGGTAGSEVVTVTGTAISIEIEDGVSTATQVKAKFDAEAAAVALASAAITGTAGNAQVAAVATPLAGGITGGARGSLMCVGV